MITDGWVGYNGLAGLGYAHERRNQKAAARRGEDPGELLPAVHRVASLCKRWLLGTHQGRVEPAHLQAYLNEFAFRFNRRRSRSRGMVFYRVLELAAGHDPVRYDDIRATRKPRSKPPQQRGTGHPPSLDRPAAARPWRTAEMQLPFPLRLSGYPGPGFHCVRTPWAQWVVATVPVDDPFRVHLMRAGPAGCRARAAGPLGLALDACRPGAAEVSGVQAGPQGRRRRRCASSLEAGGAAPDTARRPAGK